MNTQILPGKRKPKFDEALAGKVNELPNEAAELVRNIEQQIECVSGTDLMTTFVKNDYSPISELQTPNCLRALVYAKLGQKEKAENIIKDIHRCCTTDFSIADKAALGLAYHNLGQDARQMLTAVKDMIDIKEVCYDKTRKIVVAKNVDNPWTHINALVAMLFYDLGQKELGHEIQHGIAGHPMLTEEVRLGYEYFYLHYTCGGAHEEYEPDLESSALVAAMNYHMGKDDSIVIGGIERYFRKLDGLYYEHPNQDYYFDAFASANLALALAYIEKQSFERK
jgi:hypothetical protein